MSEESRGWTANLRWFDDSRDDEHHRRNAMYRNLAFGVLHLSLAIAFIIAWAVVGVSDFYTTRTVAFVFNKTVSGSEIVRLSNPSLDTCVNVPGTYNASWNSENGWGYQPVAVKSFFISKFLFILAFIAITSTAHFIRAALIMQAGFLFDVIKEGRPRWDRWLEYSLSSPCMLIVIAGTTGVSDAWTLGLLGISQFTLCFYGYAIELFDWTLNNAKLEIQEKNAMNDVAGMFPSMNVSYGRTDPPAYRKNIPVKLNVPWNIKRIGINVPNPAYYEQNQEYYQNHENYDSPPASSSDVIVNPEEEPLASPFSIKKVMRTAKWLLLLNGMYTFFFQWLCIILSFTAMSDGFNCINKPTYLTSLTKSIPELIIATEFILFIAFPFLQIYYNFFNGVSIAKNYGWKSELVYGWLSVFSKAVLTILLIIQATIQQFNK